MEPPTFKPLAFVFDIDGTLIAEGGKQNCGMGGQSIRIRPGAIEFIQWCQQRGHSVALWTKARHWWANKVATEICSTIHPDHECTGRTCRKLFAFCWHADHLRRVRQPPLKWAVACHEQPDIQAYSECKWCEAYSHSCRQCECAWNYECPCQEVKDLRKIWYSKEHAVFPFTQERTLLVEDTPQNCRFNYGNGIYIRKYKGQLSPVDQYFDKLRIFVQTELEGCETVRQVRKCDHPIKRYHACYDQIWWNIEI